MNDSINILRVRGLEGSDDYIQIRDESFTLIANLKLKPPYDSIIRFANDSSKAQRIIDSLIDLPYGKLTKIEF